MFIEALAATGCVRDACRAVGISSNSAYRTRRKLPCFARDWRLAQRQAGTSLDLLAFERATVGAVEVVKRDGKVVQTRQKPSDAMLRLLLQASNPEKYGRTMGRGGGYYVPPPEPPIEEVRAEILRKIEAMERHERQNGKDDSGR